MNRKKMIGVIVGMLGIVATLSGCSGSNGDSEGAPAESMIESNQDESKTEVDASDYYEEGRERIYGLNEREVDPSFARVLMEDALEGGYSDANFYLGLLCHMYGQPEIDFQAAKSYYEACEGNSYAEIALGFLYFNGQGVEKDVTKAQELFQGAVDQGVVEGYAGLAAIANAEERYDEAVEYYNQVINEGTEQIFVMESMSYLGWMYHNADSVERNYTTAREWFEKAEAMGDSQAMYGLGHIYYWGEGDEVEKDYVKALEYYVTASNMGVTDAMYQVGYVYEHEDSMDYSQSVRDSQAMEWYKKGVELNNLDCIKALASIYRRNMLENPFEYYDQVIELYSQGAALGDIHSMHLVGYMYDCGYEVEDMVIIEPDYVQAIEWYEKAAADGYLSSINNMAFLYADGLGVEQDEARGVELMEQAATAGNATSMKNLGDWYFGGSRGLEQDYAIAMEWYQKAADAGNTTGMTAIADMYRYGNGVEKDGEKAIEWYEKAANAGNTTAMRNIAYMYGNGDGVGRDALKEIQWYEAAANAGDVIGMTSAAVLYMNGNGIEQDWNKALEWSEKAADAGNARAMCYAGIICQEMGDYETAEVWYQEAVRNGYSDAVSRLAAVQALLNEEAW